MCMSADTFADISTFINGADADIIDLQTRLTATPALAPENGGDGELKKAQVLEQWLRDKGFARFVRYDAPDSRVSGGIRPNLVLTLPGASDEKTIWFIAHLDVVPAGERALWRTDPWTVTEKDGVLYGRGVEDNQQGLVSAVLAALALKHCGVKPAFTVKLLFCADEEVGSAYGVSWLIANTDIFRPQDLIYIPDGGDSKGATIEVAEKNLLWLRVHTVGRQTHGSRPDEGNNAFLAASDLLLQLNALEKEFNARDERFEPPYSTFQPTLKEANVPNLNTIPGDDVFGMDCRILPCYPLAQVTKRMNELTAATEKKHGVRIEYTMVQANESPATPEDSPAVARLAAAIQSVTGQSARTVGIGGGTVAAVLRKAGFIHCAVWSTLDETAHQPNEYCVIENLKSDAKVIAFMCAEP